jgi:hypothetical protein
MKIEKLPAQIAQPPTPFRAVLDAAFCDYTAESEQGVQTGFPADLVVQIFDQGSHLIPPEGSKTPL